MPCVHFIGRIVGCHGLLPPRLSLWGLFGSPTAPPLTARWSIDASQGTDQTKWRVIEGESNGKTWLAERDAPNYACNWSSPIDVTFACSSLSGWPMLTIQVMETDWLDRQDLAGYGSVRLPCSPGLHSRCIPLHRPLPSSPWVEWTSFFVGGRPRYESSRGLTSVESRYGLRTESVGMVTIEIQVTIQGLDGAVRVGSSMGLLAAQVPNGSTTGQPLTSSVPHVQVALSAMDESEEEMRGVCIACPPSKTRGQERREASYGEDEDEDIEEEEQKTLLRKEQ